MRKLAYVKPTIQTLGSQNVSLNGETQPTGIWYNNVAVYTEYILAGYAVAVAAVAVSVIDVVPLSSQDKN